MSWRYPARTPGPLSRAPAPSSAPLGPLFPTNLEVGCESARDDRVTMTSPLCSGRGGDWSSERRTPMRLPRARAPVAVASLLLACCCCLAPTRTRADVCGKPSKETWEGECSASAVSGRPLRARRAFTSAGAAPIGRRGRGGCCCVSADAGRVRAGRSAAGANRTARAFTCWRTGPGTRARCRALHTRACCRVCCGCVRVRCGARAPRTGEQERQQHSVPLTRACAAVQERAARRMGHLHVDQRPALRGRVEGRAASWPGPRPLLPRARATSCVHRPAPVCRVWAAFTFRARALFLCARDIFSMLYA